MDFQCLVGIKSEEKIRGGYWLGDFLARSIIHFRYKLRKKKRENSLSI